MWMLRKLGLFLYRFLQAVQAVHWRLQAVSINVERYVCVDAHMEAGALLVPLPASHTKQYMQYNM
jgi:hypothetical protein